MTVGQFNKKWTQDGWYGLEFHCPYTINFLDGYFSILKEQGHDPQVHQIKYKFDNIRVYTTLPHTTNQVLEAVIEKNSPHYKETMLKQQVRETEKAWQAYKKQALKDAESGIPNT